VLRLAKKNSHFVTIPLLLIKLYYYNPYPIQTKKQGQEQPKNQRPKPAQTKDHKGGQGKSKPTIKEGTRVRKSEAHGQEISPKTGGYLQ
jgi:hypothetical protein